MMKAMVTVLLTASVVIELVVAECFINGKDAVKMYANDRPAFDLSSNSYGNDIDFLISDGGNQAYIDPTFKDLKEGLVLSEGVDNCTRAIQLNQTDVVFLCDHRIVIVATYDEIQSQLLSATKYHLGSQVTCHSLEKSLLVNELLVACLNSSDPSPFKPLIFLSFDLVKKQTAAVIQVDQEIMQNFIWNITMSVYHPQNDPDISVIVFLREDVEYAPIRIKAFSKSAKTGEWSYSGFFQGSDNITGVNASTASIGFATMGNNFFLMVRNSSNYKGDLVRCSVRLMDNEIACNDWASYGRLDMDFFGIELFPFAPSYKNYWQLIVASNQTTKWLQLDPDTPTWGMNIVSVYNMSQSSVTFVKGAFVSNGTAYLIGKSRDNKNVVVVYRGGRPTYEDRVLPDERFKVVVIRSGFTPFDDVQMITIRNGVSYSASIGKPKLIIVPRPDCPTKFTVTVACFSRSAFWNSFTVEVEVIKSLIDDVKMFLPQNLTLYAGSNSTQLPLISSWLQANAPQLKVADPQGLISTSVEFSSQTATSKYVGSPITVSSSISLGHGYIALINDLTLTVVCCSVTHQSGTCTSKMDFDISNYLVLDAAANLNQLTIALKTRPSPGKSNGSSLRIVVYSTQTFQRIADKSFANLDAQIGAVHSNETDTNVVICGYLPESPSTMSLAAILSLDGSQESFTKALDFTQGFIPGSISMRPNVLNVQTVYVAGHFGARKTNRIYKINLMLGKVDSSAIVLMFSRYLNSTSNFALCASNYGLAVIAFDLSKVFMYDLASGPDTSLDMPVKQYGVSTVSTFNCDPDTNLLQVIGGDDSSSNYRLITYRLDPAAGPNRRVHSVLKLQSSGNHVASWDTADPLKIHAAVFGYQSSDLSLFTFIYDSPRIVVDASNTTDSTPRSLAFSLKVEAENKTYETVASVDFRLPRAKTNISIGNRRTSKDKVEDGTPLSLDSYLAFDGHFFKAALKTSLPGVTLQQRLKPRSDFSWFKQQFKQVVVDGDLAFGFTDNQILLQEKGQTLALVDQVTCIDIGVLPNQTGFAALTYPRGKVSGYQIYIFSNVSGTWKAYSQTPQADTYTRMVFLATKLNVVFVGLNNETQQVDIGTLNITAGSVVQYDFKSIQTPLPIDFFDIVMLSDQSSFLMVSTEGRGSIFRYSLFKIGSGGYFWKADEQTDPVDTSFNVSRVIRGMECELYPSQNDTITCLQMEEGITNRFISLKVNASHSFREKLVNRTDSTELFNLANVKTVRGAIFNNISAIVVKNTDVRTNDISWRANPYFVVVYAAHISNHTFKFLFPEDLGYPSGTSLAALSVFFFLGEDGNPKLAVVSGKESTSSINTFDLSELILTVANSNSIVDPPILLLTTLDSQTVDSDLGQVLEFIEPEDSKKSYTVIILIISLIVLLVLIVLAIIWYQYRSKKDDAELYNIQATSVIPQSKAQDEVDDEENKDLQSPNKD